MRILYGLIVTVLPIACFSVSNGTSPQWQDGRLSSYAAILLDRQAAMFFFPFILYSSISLITLLINPQRYARYFAIRLGIYSGMVLALQYALILSVLGNSFIVTIYILFILLMAGLRYQKIPIPIWASLVLGLGVILFSATIYLAGSFGSLREIYYQLMLMPYVALAITLILAPLLCFWVLARTAANLYNGYEKPVVITFWRGTGLAVWLAGYIVAWSLSILKMFEVYEALPTSPPDCYIATAAARGHLNLVGSYTTHLPTGAFCINRQLQTLKCAELALLALTPGIHRLLRKLYDTLGRPASHLIAHPVLADLAYLSLKPFEWITRLALGLLIPNFDDYSARLYH
jgi:hypothetical protein